MQVKVWELYLFFIMDKPTAWESWRDHGWCRGGHYWSGGYHPGGISQPTLDQSYQRSREELWKCRRRGYSQDQERLCLLGRQHRTSDQDPWIIELTFYTFISSQQNTFIKLSSITFVVAFILILKICWQLYKYENVLILKESKRIYSYRQHYIVCFLIFVTVHK